MMPGGKPADYKPEMAKQAAKLCELGATDHELADFFGVSTRTIYRWRNSHPEFCQAVIAGKENADARVARSLYNRAVGYTYESEKIFHHQGNITRADFLEHVPPDPSAAMNWLKNRQRHIWGDKPDDGFGEIIEGEAQEIDVSERETARRIAFALDKGVRAG